MRNQLRVTISATATQCLGFGITDNPGTFSRRRYIQSGVNVGEYSPQAQWLRYRKLSLFELCRRDRTPILTNDITVKYNMKSFRCYELFQDYLYSELTFSASLSHSLMSVVSMELWSPHKMAKIRHSDEGVPDPRICG